MKKSYKGFPIYALIIIGVLIATQLFSSSFSSQRGQKIEAAKLFEYIDSGVIDAVALESSTAYAHMKASSIPLSAFSNAAYDFSAVISRDTFVETCRQLAARKAGKPLEDITEIDLGFDLIYLPQPATPWLLDMLPYIIMTVGLKAQFESARGSFHVQSYIYFSLLNFRTINVSEIKVIQYKLILSRVCLHSFQINFVFIKFSQSFSLF